MAKKNENKAAAILRGDTTYDSTPCKRCGGTERYISGGCIVCSAKRAKEYANKNRQTISNAMCGADKEKRAAVQAMLDKAQDEAFPNSIKFVHKEMK